MDFQRRENNKEIVYEWSEEMQDAGITKTNISSKQEDDEGAEKLGQWQWGMKLNETGVEIEFLELFVNSGLQK